MTYVQHLQAAFHLRLRQVFEYYFIHDRPSWAHTALTHDWFVIIVLCSCTDNYPLISPDLNAVEGVRAWMNRCVQRNHLNCQQRIDSFNMRGIEYLKT